MSSSSSRAAHSPSPLLEALYREAATGERLVVRGGLYVSLACLLLCPVGALAVGIGPVLWVALLAGLSTGWFVLRIFLDDKISSSFAQRVTFWLAVAIPGLYLVVSLARMDPRVVIASWVPTQLALSQIMVAMFSLRPREPFVISAAFSVQYGAVMWAAQATFGLPAPHDDVRFHIFRVATTMLLGLVGTLAVAALKRAIEKAGLAVRARDLLGKYQLGETIGVGGMGSVVAATYCPDGGFERPVAIKRLHPHLASSAEAVAAFRAEAALSARLVHPNIVAALDFGRADDSWFLAMERVEGSDLSSLLRTAGDPLPVDVAVRIALDVLRGLSFAHEDACDREGAQLRIVHRDLSPSNILVSESGEVKIADFGVASALRDQEARFTTTIRGKLRYLDPERARAEPFDHRADLFALGVILWEMLALRPLFARGSEPAGLAAVAEGDVPPISRERSDLEPHWDAFFARALAPLAADRFASAREMAEHLEKLSPEASRPNLVAWLREHLPGARALGGRRPNHLDELPTVVDTMARAAALPDLVTRAMRPAA